MNRLFLKFRDVIFQMLSYYIKDLTDQAQTDYGCQASEACGWVHAYKVCEPLQLRTRYPDMLMHCFTCHNRGSKSNGFTRSCSSQLDLPNFEASHTRNTLYIQTHFPLKYKLQCAEQLQFTITALPSQIYIVKPNFHED